MQDGFPKLLTATEAADRLRIAPSTMRAMLCRGEVPGAFRLNPNSSRSEWRIPETAVKTKVTGNVPSRTVGGDPRPISPPPFSSPPAPDLASSLLGINRKKNDSCMP